MKTVPSHNLEKAEWRRTLRRARAALSSTQRQQYDHAINAAIIEWMDQHGVSVVGAYIAFDGEPDLQASFKHLLQRNGVVALPVIVEQANQRVIEFRQYTSSTRMETNRFGIPEPCGTPLIRPTDLELVLMPLVGWNSDGNRLGMGASFYDRFFQPLEQLTVPVRAGVAYHAQYCQALPSDPWDISMHQLFSEQGLVSFNQEEIK